ncbi:hypothetical protein J6P92_05225 [bacterium]|nr:hypothetical protein [bacterium]
MYKILDKQGFTLAEGATHVVTSDNNRIFAFTLSEVLITLGIIGVVASITLPALFTNITGYVNTKRQENIGQKVTQAMEHMRAHGLLNTQYATTDAFVDELQKYLKIAKRCDSNHVADCWPTTVVTTGDGEEYEVSQAKTGKHLSLESESNNVGLILADGASIILNYNPDAPGIDVGDKVQWISGLPQYTTSVTGAIDFVMDVNGGKSPNSEKAGDKRDIRPFKKASFTEVIPCEGIEVPSVGCVLQLSNTGGGSSEWNNVKNLCSNKGMMLPTAAQISKIKISNQFQFSSDWSWYTEGCYYSSYWGAEIRSPDQCYGSMNTFCVK